MIADVARGGYVEAHTSSARLNEVGRMYLLGRVQSVVFCSETLAAECSGYHSQLVAFECCQRLTA